MAKIMKLKVHHILRVEEAEIQPNGKSLTIGGENEQGKSSLLSAIKMALGGSGHVPDQPTHNGADKGEVEVVLDDGLIVHMQVKKDGKRSVAVRTQDGAKYDKPREMLDRLFPGLVFDPGLFEKADSKKQRSMLLQAAGIDLSSLDDKRKLVFEERTLVNRELKRAQAAYEALPEYPEVGGDKVDIALEMNVLRDLQEEKRTAAENDKQYRDTTAHIQSIDNSIADNERMILEAQERIARARAKREEVVQHLEQLKEVILSSRSDDEIEVEIVAVNSRLSRAQEISEQCVANDNKQKAKANVEKLQAESEALTKRLEAMDKQKEEIFKASPLPLPELSVSDEGVLYKGFPLEQASESAQAKIAIATAFALSKGSILVMSKSGGLCATRREEIRQLAEELGVQLFLEVVDTPDDVQLVMEDGRVVEAETAEAA